MSETKKYSSALVLCLFFVFDCYVWYSVFSGVPASSPEFHFLDVGQGDAELVVLPGNVKVMTDAGPTKKVLGSLERILPKGDKYIDIAVISHPQLDHFNGFYFLLDHYAVGAFIVNGRDDTKGVVEWPALLQKIKSHHVPLIVLGAGDSVRYGSSSIAFLSPDVEHAMSGELNDTGFVEYVQTPRVSALFTADIDATVERFLADRFLLAADILKIPHHGSRYSSSDAFLAAVHPKFAIIEVGTGNHYGHPAPETLARLASSGVPYVFRTDRDGSVTLRLRGEKLAVFTHQ